MGKNKHKLILLGYICAILIGLAIPVVVFREVNHHWIYHTNNTLPAPAHIIVDIISPIVSDPENPLTATKVLEYVIMFFSACATFSIYRFVINKYEHRR
jgi:hypothetical protein